MLGTPTSMLMNVLDLEGIRVYQPVGLVLNRNANKSPNDLEDFAGNLSL